MQQLGLSDTTPRTESRFRNLFWPTIRNDGDLDYLTEQGFWICTVVSAVTLTFALLGGPGWTVCFAAAFDFLAGVGVRMRSRAAAIIAFSAYLTDAIVMQEYGGQGFGV